MRPRRIQWVVLAGVVVTATATGVEIESGVTAGVLHTDNLTQVATRPEPETMLLVVPSISVIHDSPRLSANVAYELQGSYFDRLNETDVLHRFDGTSRLWVVPEHFFLDTGATRMQTIVDRESAINFRNLPHVGNLADRDEYYGGPAVQFAPGSLTGSASFRRTWTRYSGAAVDDEMTGRGLLADFEYDQGVFDVDNYRARRGLAWALRYRSDKVDYGKPFLPYQHRVASAELGFWAGPSTRLFVIGGKESPWDDPSDSSVADSLWEAGLNSEMGQRLTVEFAVGERSFGDSRRARLDLALRRGQTTMRYEHAPITTAMTHFRGGLLRPDDPPDFLFRAGAVERYVSKRFLWDLTLNWRRTDFSFRILDESREERASLDGTALPEESQSVIDASVAWRAGARTEIVLSGRDVRRTFASSEQADLWYASIVTNYMLGSRSQVSLGYERWNEKPRLDEAALPSYTVSVLALFLTREF